MENIKEKPRNDEMSVPYPVMLEDHYCATQYILLGAWLIHAAGAFSKNATLMWMVDPTAPKRALRTLRLNAQIAPSSQNWGKKISLIEIVFSHRNFAGFGRRKVIYPPPPLDTDVPRFANVILLTLIGITDKISSMVEKIVQ